MYINKAYLIFVITYNVTMHIDVDNLLSILVLFFAQVSQRKQQFKQTRVFKMLNDDYDRTALFRFSLAFILVTTGCAGGKTGTRFLRPRGTSPLKGETPGYRNGTKSFFGLKGRPSVVRDV